MEKEKMNRRKLTDEELEQVTGGQVAAAKSATVLVGALTRVATALGGTVM